MKTHLLPSIIILTLATACGTDNARQLAQAQLEQQIADANCPTYVQHPSVNGGPASTTYYPGCLGAPVIEQAPVSQAPIVATLPGIDTPQGDANTAAVIDSNATVTAPPSAPDSNCVQRDASGVNHYECGTWYASAYEETDCPTGNSKLFRLVIDSDGNYSDLNGELVWFGQAFTDEHWDVSATGAASYTQPFSGTVCHFAVMADGR